MSTRRGRIPPLSIADVYNIARKYYSFIVNDIVQVNEYSSIPQLTRQYRPRDISDSKACTTLSDTVGFVLDQNQIFDILMVNGTSHTVRVLESNVTTMRYLASQVAILAYCEASGYLQDTSVLVRDVNNAPTITYTTEKGNDYVVCWFKHTSLKTLKVAKPHSAEILFLVGQYIGTLNMCLDKMKSTRLHQQEYMNVRERTEQPVPAVFHSERAAKPLSTFDLQHADTIITAYMTAMVDESRRTVLDRFIGQFEMYVVPHCNRLPTSVVCSNTTDTNILVRTHRILDVLSDHKTCIGLVSLEGVIRTWRVSSICVAAAHAMIGKANPLAAAGHVIRGYHAVSALSDMEISVLFPLMCVRLCLNMCVQVLCSSPEHEEICPSAYQQATSKMEVDSTWALLKSLSLLSPELAHYRLRAACGLNPVCASASVVQWLSLHQGEFAPVLTALDKRVQSSTHVLNLSVGSSIFAGIRNSRDMAVALSTIIQDEMEDSREKVKAHIAVGVGRYNEARLIYTGEHFVHPTDELPERRTVHLGMDLFPSEKCPSANTNMDVYAPLDGIVHSCKLNYSNHMNDSSQDMGPTIILQHTITCTNAKPLIFYTLYGHLSSESVHGVHVGEVISRGEKFGTIGRCRMNTTILPPHLHFQIIINMLGTKGGFWGVCAPSERSLWLSLCPDPNLILNIHPSSFPRTEEHKYNLLESRRKHLSSNLSVSYSEPLHIVRALEQFLYDIDGYSYLDVVNNVCHVGHCHPHVVKVAARQMGVLNTNTRYVYEHLTKYAEKLTATMPDPLNVCFFVNSGSEANDLALRLARAHTTKHDIICLDIGYHGNLTSLIDISPYKHDGPGGKGPAPSTHVAIMPDPYRGKYTGTGRHTGEKYAHHVETIVHELEAKGVGVAAFIAESVLGCGGQIVLPEGYLASAYKHVRKYGGVCIADEVQVGFGRMGETFWGFQTQGVIPDIVTMGKPIGNGHPLGAVVTTAAIAKSFANGMEYFNTFGGNPVSCAIGLAVLEVIEKEKLQAHAYKVGNRLMNGLRALMEKHILIGDVRGIGLFVGVELVLNRVTKAPAGEHATYVANRMRGHGILISTDGPDHNVLKIKPPMVFGEADADRLLKVLNSVLEEDAIQVE
eukprot:CFRG4629T1